MNAPSVGPGSIWIDGMLICVAIGTITNKQWYCLYFDDCAWRWPLLFKPT